MYQIFETINNYYFYVISQVDDKNIVLMQFEHTSANKSNEPLYNHLNSIGWDDIDIEKSDIKAIDIINSSFVSDDKFMNISNSYTSLIPEKASKQKKEKIVKEKIVKEKKVKEPKQKKEKTVKIDTVNTQLNME